MSYSFGATPCVIKSTFNNRRVLTSCFLSVRLVPSLLASLLFPFTLLRLAAFNIHYIRCLRRRPQPHMTIFTTSHDSMVLFAISTTGPDKGRRSLEKETYLCEKQNVSDNLLAMRALERYRLRRTELPFPVLGRRIRTQRCQRQRSQTVVISISSTL